MRKFGSNTSEKEAKNSKMIPKMLAMRIEAKKRSETKWNEAKFFLFVSQTEAKIMRNWLCFASIAHEAKKNSSKKGTPYFYIEFPFNVYIFLYSNYINVMLTYLFLFAMVSLSREWEPVIVFVKGPQAS
jgi:hypothetical protein